MWVVGIWSQVLILCGRSFTHWYFPTDPCSAFYLGPEDHTRVSCLRSKYFNKWFGFFWIITLVNSQVLLGNSLLLLFKFFFQYRMDLLFKFEIYINLCFCIPVMKPISIEYSDSLSLYRVLCFSTHTLTLAAASHHPITPAGRKARRCSPWFLQVFSYLMSSKWV